MLNKCHYSAYSGFETALCTSPLQPFCSMCQGKVSHTQINGFLDMSCSCACITTVTMVVYTRHHIVWKECWRQHTVSSHGLSPGTLGSGPFFLWQVLNAINPSGYFKHAVITRNRENHSQLYRFFMLNLWSVLQTSFKISFMLCCDGSHAASREQDQNRTKRLRQFMNKSQHAKFIWAWVANRKEKWFLNFFLYNAQPFILWVEV